MNSTPDATLNSVPEGEWKLAHEPNDTEPWYGWQKPADSNFSLYLKFVINLEGVHPDKVLLAYSPDHIKNWSKQSEYSKVIEENFDDKWNITYSHMQKIPVPIID